MKKNAHYIFLQSKVKSSNCFFYSTNSPNPKDSSLRVIKVRQQIFIFKGLGPAALSVSRLVRKNSPLFGSHS